MDNRYLQYLKELEKPFKKICKIDFLQPDGSVAFTLDNNENRRIGSKYDSRAFIQSGDLSVSLQNGQRRSASVTLSNLDGQFDYSVNKIWFGRQIRLSMGLVLPDGSNFYLPQGVFYVQQPNLAFSPSERTISLPLVDKWTYLDGTLFGNLGFSYQVNKGTNIFNAIESLLQLSKFDFNATSDILRMIDNVPPIFTSFYNGKTYSASRSDGSITSDIPMTNTPYTMTTSATGTIAEMILNLNETIAGLVGYDCTGALRIEPSQDDVNDADKPVLWSFTPENSRLIGLSEKVDNSSVYNNIIVAGEGLTGREVYATATNFDPRSDTNANIIGLHTLRIENAAYWNKDQCADLAEWQLKRKTILQKSVSIESTQMFHLQENRLVSVERTDKDGSPIERHVIQSFSIPLSENGSMTINAVSVNDIPDFTITTN